MTSVGRMQCSNLTTTNKTKELITHLYACWGAASHQYYADADADAGDEAVAEAVADADAVVVPNKPDWLSGSEGKK